MDASTGRALIDLRTAQQQRLAGRLEPETLRLHVRLRGEEAVFDLAALARVAGVEVLVRVNTGAAHGDA